MAWGRIAHGSRQYLHLTFGREKSLWRNWSGSGTQVLKSCKVRQQRGNKTSPQESPVQTSTQKAHRLGWTTAKGITSTGWWDKPACSCPECQLIKMLRSYGGIKWTQVKWQMEKSVFIYDVSPPLHTHHDKLQQRFFIRFHGRHADKSLKGGSNTEGHQSSGEEDPIHYGPSFYLEGKQVWAQTCIIQNQSRNMERCQQ